MFALLKFDNNETQILPSTKITKNNKGICTVNCGGAKYRAELLASSDNKNDLKNIQKPVNKDWITTVVNNEICAPQSSSAEFGHSITKNLKKNIQEIDCHSSSLAESFPKDLYNPDNACSSQIVKSIDNTKDLIDIQELLNEIDAISTIECTESVYIFSPTTEFCSTGHDSALTCNKTALSTFEGTDETLIEETTFLNQNISVVATQPQDFLSTNVSSELTYEGNELRQEIPSVVNESINISVPNLENLVNLNTLYVKGSASVSKSNRTESNKDLKSKTHCCPFCKELQTKFARHIERKHANNEEVKKILHLPKRNIDRIKVLDSLRKKGDFMHNTDLKINTGTLIVTRRKQEKSKAECFICCKYCKGFYSRKTIRLHVIKCDLSRKKGKRNLLNSGRATVGNIHACACNTLRLKVFPVIRDDEIGNAIKFDELIIKFGNKLCEKYTLVHQHEHIRAQMRLLGRFKLEILKLDNTLTEFKQIFKPQHFNNTVASLRTVAKWNDDHGYFETPSVAQNLTTLIKKCGKKLRTELIKIEDEDNKKKVDNFLTLWEEEIPTLINKKALEDQHNQKRKKKIVLPAKKDIKCLYDYLKKECNKSLEVLSKNFDYDAWSQLTKCTLILIQIFNRRRAGEIERLTISNFKTQEAIDENVDKNDFQNLSESTIQFTKQFVRLSLRGKLGRNVPLLLSPFDVHCIENILQYRVEAGVSAKNEYIFSVPTANSFSQQYLRACPLMRQFSQECGAQIPSSLRGTTLRKHIATYTSMLNVEEGQIDRLANFMGHHKDIHKNIYRVNVPAKEITEVSQLLLAAIGEGKHESINRQNGNSSNSSESSDSCNEEFLPSTSKAKIVSSNSLSCQPEINSNNSNDVSNSSSKRRSRSPFGRTIRNRWLCEEKDVIRKCFGNVKLMEKLPSLKECTEIIRKYPVLKSRTPQQMKSWIDNQRKSESRRKKTVVESSEEE